MKIPISFYYNLGASTALLPFLLRFVSFEQNLESQRIRRPVAWTFDKVTCYFALFKETK